MTTPRVVATELDQILTHLYERGIVYFWNEIKTTNDRVTWHSTSPFEAFLTDRDRTTIDGYLHWLTSGMYSALLIDGSLLQVTYDFEGSEIVGHRLAYVPCPVVMDKELLAEGIAPADIVALLIDEPRKILMRTPVRFDFDPVNAGPLHPTSHFTINSSDCRVACASPLRLGRFIDFVFKNFYPSVHKTDPVLNALPQTGWFKRTIAPEESEIAHFSWPQ